MTMIPESSMIHDADRFFCESLLLLKTGVFQKLPSMFFSCCLLISCVTCVGTAEGNKWYDFMDSEDFILELEQAICKKHEDWAAWESHLDVLVQKQRDGSYHKSLPLVAEVDWCSEPIQLDDASSPAPSPFHPRDFFIMLLSVDAYCCAETQFQKLTGSITINLNDVDNAEWESMDRCNAYRPEFETALIGCIDTELGNKGMATLSAAEEGELRIYSWDLKFEGLEAIEGLEEETLKPIRRIDVEVQMKVADIGASKYLRRGPVLLRIALCVKGQTPANIEVDLKGGHCVTEFGNS